MAAPMAAADVGGGVGREKGREKCGRRGGLACVLSREGMTFGGGWYWLKFEGGPKFFFAIDSSYEGGEMRENKTNFFNVRRSLPDTEPNQIHFFFFSFLLSYIYEVNFIDKNWFCLLKIILLSKYLINLLKSCVLIPGWLR